MFHAILKNVHVILFHFHILLLFIVIRIILIKAVEVAFIRAFVHSKKNYFIQKYDCIKIVKCKAKYKYCQAYINIKIDNTNQIYII